MAVAALTEFPSSLVAGDTVRVTLADALYPSSDWTLKVFFRGNDGSITSFAADSVADDEFELVIPASASLKLKPGSNTVSFVYTETSSAERVSKTFGKVEVLPNPTQQAAKTIARKTLEAMEAALEKLAGGSNLTVNFNGQSFTKKNLKDLQDAIDRQRAIVAREEQESDLAAGTKRRGGIGIRFA